MIDIKKSSYTILTFIIAGIFVFNCNSIWTALPNANNKTSYLCLVIVSVLVLLINKIKLDNLVYLLSISAIVGIYGLIYGIVSDFSSSLLILITLAIIFILLIGQGESIVFDILSKYSWLIVVIAAISIIFWIFGSNLKWIKPTGTVLSTWASGSNYYSRGVADVVPSYFGIYFETQTVSGLSFFSNMIRNTAIFTEAPMASLNFSLALLINIYYRQKIKRSNLKNFILILAILTTFSTTGYILLVLLGFSYLFYSKNKLIIKYRNILLPVLGIIFILVIFVLFNQKSNYDTGSSSIRSDDYKVGYQAFKDHPILGLGLANNMLLVQNYMENWRSYNTGLSSSVVELFSFGGLYLGFPYIFSFIRGIFLSIKNKNKEKMFFVLMTLYLFILTIFTFKYITIFLLVWFGLSSSHRYKKIYK